MQHDDFESKCSNKIVFLLQIKRNKFNTKTLKISKNAQQKTEHLLLESAEENTFGSKYSNKLESALLERCALIKLYTFNTNQQNPETYKDSTF